MSEHMITWDQDADGVVTLTMDDPQARVNTMNERYQDAMDAVVDRLEAERDTVTGVVLTSAKKTFFAGGDLNELIKVTKADAKPFYDMILNIKGQLRRLETLGIPVVAALNGSALGGGLEIALSCDMIVANRNAKFGIPEVKRGLAAAAGGLIRMPRQMPIRVAMEFALTGEFFGAERAHQLGIINRVTDGPALDAALELAAAIGANGPLAVKASKQVVVESRLWPEDQMWKKQQEIVGPVFVSEDAREGAAAFAEKRAPNWKGK